jgi:hypothetical protein
MLQATRVYVNLILNVCTRTRAQLGLEQPRRHSHADAPTTTPTTVRRKKR